MCGLKPFLASVSSKDEIKHSLWEKQSKTYCFLKGLNFNKIEISVLNCLEIRRALSLGLQVGWFCDTVFKIIF